MVRYPHAKVNLGLHILERMPDGYHSIETVFLPIKLCDTIEIQPGKRAETTLKISGLEVAGPLEKNLCFKAWELLRKDYGIPSIDIHLLKNIPLGAGLGGGSSNGAFTLRMLNELFMLGLSNKELALFALQLGMDCPFFLHDTPALGRGRGEQLTPLEINLSGYNLVLIKPDIHVSTAEAYAGIKPIKRRHSLEQVIQLPVQKWRENLVNDFEISVFQRYPEIGRIKAVLYSQGAIYASMSGSGSSVFGIFSEIPDFQDLFTNSFVWTEEL